MQMNVESLNQLCSICLFVYLVDIHAKMLCVLYTKLQFTYESHCN
jgi:hypothetical protein